MKKNDRLFFWFLSILMLGSADEEIVDLPHLSPYFLGIGFCSVGFFYLFWRKNITLFKNLLQ
jgi:hypothetical protein